MSYPRPPRSAVAAAAGVNKLKVMIDRVRPPNLVAKDGYPPALEVYFQVQMASDKEAADALTERFLANPTDIVRAA